MGKAVLTILFQDPFWIGLYEREWEGRYEVCKLTFGAEPRDGEVYEFMLQNWRKLRFSPSIQSEWTAEKRVSPKRMQRLVKQQMQIAGIGTKAQQALKLQQAEGKQTAKRRSREEREAEQERRYAQRREKQKQKHKGR